MRTFFRLIIPLSILFSFAGTGLAAAGPELIGAGATFPYPLYSKMFDVYGKEYGIKVNYQAIGSGGGIRQLINKTVDFGGSDAVMSQEEMKAAGAPVLHIPTCAGAVVISFNVPGLTGIKLTADIVADLFLGKIKKWNDPRVASANPGLKLPDLPVTVIHRSDGSGTTAIFTDYLSKVNQDWKTRVGAGTSVNWPAGLGAKGNPGVAGLVKQTPGSVGYVELIYAVQNKMAYAEIENQRGKSIKASIESTTSAANVGLPDDMRVSLTNTDASEGYPISGFTWILVYKEQAYGDKPEAKARELVNLLSWMIHQGQKYAAPMDYAPLSKEAVRKAEALMESITYKGNKVMK